MASYSGLAMVSRHAVTMSPPPGRTAVSSFAAAAPAWHGKGHRRRLAVEVAGCHRRRVSGSVVPSRLVLSRLVLSAAPSYGGAWAGGASTSSSWF